STSLVLVRVRFFAGASRRRTNRPSVMGRPPLRLRRNLRAFEKRTKAVNRLVASFAELQEILPPPILVAQLIKRPSSNEGDTFGARSDDSDQRLAGAWRSNWVSPFTILH